MSDSDTPSRFVELAREDKTAASTEFVYAFEWLQESHQILQSNFRELRAIPAQFERDPTLVPFENRARRVALLLEFVRRLHNYLASVKTLVDHTRSFRERHMSDATFDVEHSQRLEQLLDTPVVKFLQDFRNPVLHSHLPRVALTIADRAGQLRRQLTVSVAELVPMYGWSVGARRYIEDAQEGKYADQKYIDLAAAAERYQAAIGGFYDWFYSSVSTVKREQIREFATRREELGRLQAALRRRHLPTVARAAFGLGQKGPRRSSTRRSPGRPR